MGTFALTFALSLERYILDSISPFILSVSVSINTGIKIKIGSGPIQKRQCLHQY